MIFFISVLRALAAMIITNSHYTGVYPHDVIANGGLYGDVIFFAVSGFCLINVNQDFKIWYPKRILRCYPAVIIITAVYIFVGFYQKSESFMDFVKWFIYPTNYHFIASIVLLYIPFYFVAKTEKLRSNILRVMGCILILFGLYYIIVYDKSYYHIDKVAEPTIRILFFESMLLGAYFKVNIQKFINKSRPENWLMFAIAFLVYFVSKLAFVKFRSISNFQILNQFLLMALLYYTFKCLCGIDDKLEKLPTFIKKAVDYISEITLEIYVVQYAIIPRLANVAVFPMNWILITVSILAAATVLRFVVKLVNKQTDKLFVNTR